jgi:DNA topoisomerase II
VEYIIVSFKPDFKGFNMFDDDIMALLKKHTYDLSGCLKGIEVYFNGERVRVRNFKEFVLMHLNGIDNVIDS